MSIHGRLIAVSLCWCVGCASPTSDPTELVRAEKRAHGAAARAGVFAFLDGLEGGSDPTQVGVDIRVVDRDGGLLLSSPSVGAVRAITLTDSAVATLELSVGIVDQRVVIHPFVGDAITIEHENTPLALAATTSGLAWVEARVAELEDPDDDGVKDGARIDLALVEADPHGTVVSRKPVVVPGGIHVAPWGVLTPFPIAFGLLVDSDAVHFGWTNADRNSEVLRIARASGATTVEWQGRGREGDRDPAQIGHGLGLSNGQLVVAGSIRKFASIADIGGFVSHAGTTIDIAAPIEHAAGDGTRFIVAYDNVLESFDGALTPLAFEAPGDVAGLALDDGNLVMTTRSGLYARPL